MFLTCITQHMGVAWYCYKYLLLALYKPLFFIILRPEQNGWHFVDGIFKCIFMCENVYSDELLRFIPHCAKSVRETNASLLTNARAYWAGRVENWPGQVEFYIEHITDICFQTSAPEI